VILNHDMAGYIIESRRLQLRKIGAAKAQQRRSNGAATAQQRSRYVRETSCGLRGSLC
jgi:hypothetical protein